MARRRGAGALASTALVGRRCACCLACCLLACLGGERGRPVGSECSSDDGCEPGLSCQYGRCRALCVFNRDCEAGMRCLPSSTDPDLRVCVPVDENACSGDQDCPAGLVCDDGSCHDLLDRYDSLRLALHFDEEGGGVARDAALPPNDGAVLGATRVEWEGAYALRFDGEDDVVVVEDLEGIGLTGSFTIVVRLEADWWSPPGFVVGRRQGAATDQGVGTQVHLSPNWVNVQASVDGTLVEEHYLLAAIPTAEGSRCSGYPACAALHTPLCVAGSMTTSGDPPESTTHALSVFLDGTYVAGHRLEGGARVDPGETPLTIGTMADGSTPLAGVVDAVLVFDDALGAEDIGAICDHLRVRVP